jgi:hypothetical protein
MGTGFSDWYTKVDLATINEIWTRIIRNGYFENWQKEFYRLNLPKNIPEYYAPPTVPPSAPLLR